MNDVQYLSMKLPRKKGDYGTMFHPEKDDDSEEDQEKDDDDKDTFYMWDITVKDVERIRNFFNVPDEIDEIVQPLIPEPIHTTPPNDDYVAPATKSILDKLLEEFEDEILNVTMDDEEADFNPFKDLEELERLLAEEPQSNFMEIQDKGYVRPAWIGVPEKARNRGGLREERRNIGVYTPYPQKDTFTPLIKTPKEILAMESVSFPKPPPLIETPEKQNLNKLWKLAHLVKDIRRNNQRNGNQGKNDVKVINMIKEEGNRKRPFEEGRSGLMNELTFSAIPQSQLTDEPIILEGIIEGDQVQRILVDGGSSSEIMYEHCFRNLNVNIRSRLKRCRTPKIGFSGETYHPLGVIDLRVTMGKEGRSKTVLMEFAIIKCCSLYNVIIGRTKMRSLGAVGSTIHSMIKFPTNQGVVTMETSREAIQKCKHLEKVQGTRYSLKDGKRSQTGQNRARNGKSKKIQSQ
ncbi:reverse transcriptase domain-containing protein [Tanacetum coccineum]